MELQIAAESRRSIRSYKENATITKEQVEEILKFAQLAPSWKNSQTGRYYVAIDPAKVAEAREQGLPPFNQRNSENAPVLIVTAFAKDDAGFGTDGVPMNECGNEWGAYDLGLQAALLTLKAREMGMDTLIMGIRDADALRKLMDIPETEEIVSVIALGYRTDDVEARPRKELSEIAKFF